MTGRPASTARRRHDAGRDFRHSKHRADLLALYAEVDALLGGWACACSSPESSLPLCCRFGVTGREPHPTAVELAEVRLALRTAPPPRKTPRRLPVAPAAGRSAGGAPSRSADDGRSRREETENDGACPLLSAEGRCSIYASRPFGCRTFFCHDAEGPDGRAKLPRDAVNAIGRRIADLSARFEPRDPHPRPLTRALVGDRT